VSPEDLMNEQDVSIPVLGGKEEDSAMQGKTDVYVEATGTGVMEADLGSLCSLLPRFFDGRSNTEMTRSRSC